MIAVVDRLGFTYPGAPVPALAEISAHVDAGDLVVLCGPSGGGKSTLLRALAGTVPHFHGGTMSGRVTVAGHDTATTRPAQLARWVGSVAQDPESSTVAGRVDREIAFGLENLGVPAQAMALRIEEALAAVAIEGRRRARLETLSGGLLQRVAIAAAVAPHPRLLLCDEPTSQLDPGAAEALVALLVRLNDELGVAVVCAEQRPERILGAADRVWFVEGGRLACDAPTGEAVAWLAEHRPAYLPPVARLGWATGPGDPAPPLTVKAARRRLGSGLRPQGPTPWPAAPPPQEADSPLAARLAGVVVRHRSASGEAVALDGLTLEVPRARVTALLGVNGSGKSTALRVLCGLDRSDGGSVEIAGRARSGPPEAYADRVAWVPQDPSRGIAARTVAGEIVGPRGSRAAVDVGGWLARLGLDEIAGIEATDPRDLSVGQRQRVALAAALAGPAALVLLDEPTRGLDPPLKAALAATLRGEALAGRAVVVATHDVEFAALVADRAVVLGAGRAVAAGAARAVLGASLLFAPQVVRAFGDGDGDGDHDAPEPGPGAARPRLRLRLARGGAR